MSWSAPESDGAIIRYDYRRSSDGGTTWGDPEWHAIPTSGAGEANETGYVVADLDNGETYTFAVRAVSAAGAGGPSGQAQVTLDLGICGRTRQVHTAIVDGVDSVTSCAAVTESH